MSQTTQTQRSRTTVVCDGYCDDTVAKDETVDVVAGHVVAEGGGRPPNVAVTGADGHEPVRQTWCADCSESRFGIGRTATERPEVLTAPYVTARTVAAFALGVVLATVVCSMLII